MPARVAPGTAAALAAFALLSCGGSQTPTGVATNPPAGEQGGETSSAPSAGAAQTSGTRTVLSPLGINIRSADDPMATAIGTAGQKTPLTVLDHSDRNGGWYKVQGETLTGWVSANPDLTAPGRFNSYKSAERAFNALYPEQWTFAEEPGDVLFRPQQGAQVVVARTAPTTDALGLSGKNGYSALNSSSVVVCGVTGTFVDYQVGGGPPSAASPGSPAPLRRFAQVRLKLDAAHALELVYNYDSPDQLQTFRDVYNSVTFPFPQCQQTAPPSAPASP